MPDNWAFVIAAYALAAVVLGAYWRWLARRERDLLTLAASRSDREAVRDDRDAVRDDSTSRSRQPSIPGHPRPDPGERGSLQ
jgi:CO/xanthine dehydrogenase Mo-binding subunit